MVLLPTFILILNISIFVVSVPLFLNVFPYRRRPEVRWLMVLIIAFSIISFCGLNVYVQSTLETKALFYRLRFLGLSILGQSWFFFLAYTYTNIKFLRNPWLPLVSLIPSAVTISLIIFPSAHPLLIKSYEQFQWHGASLVKFTSGPWLTYHLLTANFFAFAAIFLILFEVRKAEGVKRKQLLLLLLGGIVGLLIDIYAVNFDNTLRWAMLAGGTFLITEVSIMYAIRKHGLLDLAPIAKNIIFRETPDPVIILDAQDRALDYNKAAQEIFKLTAQDLSINWKRLKHVGEISSEQPTPEWQFRGPDQILRTYQIEIVLLDPTKNAEGKIVFFRDISTQKKIEEKLSHDIEFKANLLSLIAHDFSSILQTQSTISSHIEKEAPSELKGQMNTLTTISHTSQELLTNILRWAQDQIKKEETANLPFEVLTLVRETVENLEGSLSLKKIKVDIKSEIPLLIASGDSVMIGTVIRNILTNSIKASHPGDTIEINISKTDHELILQFKDWGAGMGEEMLNQLKTLSQKQPGSLQKGTDGFGVGLLLSQRIVSKHNGTLAFESEKDKGTLVTLTLPL